MDLTLVAALSPLILAAAMGVAVTAGVVKGMVGFAMPLVTLSGLSFFLDPKLALAGLILPTVISNFLQTFRTGVAPAIAAAREYWRYLLIVCLVIAVAAQGVAFIPNRVFYAVLGVPVVILCVLQLVGFRLTVKPEHRTRAEWIIGSISGFLGGMAGTWGPTTVLYLLAIETPKAKQMIVQGVIYGVGSIVLFLAHIQSGILNASTATFSALLIVPAFLGMQIGFRLQDRMDQELFRKVTLVVLIVAGLNLIRRAITG